MPNTIQAAGKTLSKQNASKLTEAFRAIAIVLINAGLTDSESLKQLMEESVEDAAEVADIPVVEPVEASEAKLMAEGFTSQVQRVTWHDRLKSTLKIFVRRFADAHNLTDQEYQQEYGDDQTRQQAIRSIVDDLAGILTELSRSHPGPADDIRDRWQGFEAPYAPFMLSADGGEPQAVNHVKIAFECSALSESDKVTAAKRGRRNSKNRTPITGILFRVDEPSEAVPAKGPGLPLYVPKEVAASIVNSVTGLPLDAHDNLSQHADEEIAGVMLSAELKDRDFVVHGYLWPGSKSSKVRKIMANQEKLGMSMTADAFGHEAEVDGQKVFWIDDIELNGANILFSDCATYQKTRLIVAERSNPAERDPTAIAAATTDQPTPNPENPVMEELQKQLTALTASVTEIAKNMATLQASQATLTSEVSAIQAAHKAEQEAIAAANQKQTEEERFSQLVNTIVEKVQSANQTTINETVNAAVSTAMSRFVNPSRQPQRQTTPLLAGAGASQQTSISAEAMQLQLQIARIEGELKTTPSMVDQLKLNDEKRALEQQLLMLQPV